MDLIDRRNGAAEPGHDLRRQFETQIHAGRPDVKENIARRGNGMMHAVNFAKGMEILWPRRSKETIPGFRAQPHYAGKSRFEIAEANRPQKRGKVGTQSANSDFVFPSGIDRYGQENGSPRQFGDDRL